MTEPAGADTLATVEDQAPRVPRSETAARILDAALVRFAEQGVQATSLDSLATEIGITKQTILYWFASKEELLLAVVDRAVVEIGERLMTAVAGAGPGLDQRLQAVVDAAFRLGSTDPAVLALVREVLRVGPPALPRLVQGMEPLLGGAAMALADGDGGIDAASARRMMLGAGARVIGLATEAEARADLGLPADLGWLRSRRRELFGELRSTVGTGRPMSTPSVVGEAGGGSGQGATEP